MVVASGVPNVATSYQATVPLEGAVAVKVTEPDPQMVAPFATGAAGRSLIITDLVAVEEHPFSVMV